MRFAFVALFAALTVLPSAAETVPSAAPDHITGTIVSFAAPTLTVKTAKGAITVTLAPTAKVIANQRSAFTAIKQNDFVSLTAAAGQDGKLKASEVRIFSEPLRGFGEGQYPGDKTIETRINGTVSETATMAKGKGGTLKLSFHAAAPNALGICSGHAPAPGKGGCTGEADIVIPPATPVAVWILGDPSWLEAGKALSLYAVAGRDGKYTTYGVIVERDGVKPRP